MITHRRLLIGAALAAILVTSFGGPPLPALAAAKKWLVDDNTADCPSRTHSSIGAALLVANPGDTITVCTGIYAEQVIINAKPNLKLIGKGAPVIQAPNNTDGAIILVSDSRNVVIQGLYVDGHRDFSAASTSMVGIEFDNSSGTIGKNVITRIRREPMSSAPQGFGIYVHNNAASTPKVVKIMTNTIFDYQKKGIYVDGNFKPTIVKNAIQTTSTATNYPLALHLRGLPGGTVTKNSILGDWYLGTTTTADGISLINSSNVKLSGNTVRGTFHGVYVAGETVKAEHNTITGNRFLDVYRGIFMNGYLNQGTNLNLFKGNKVIATAYYDTGPVAVIVQGSVWVTGNKIISNTIKGYPAVWYSDTGTSTTFSGNKASTVPPPGP